MPRFILSDAGFPTKWSDRHDRHWLEDDNGAAMSQEEQPRGLGNGTPLPGAQVYAGHWVKHGAF